MTHRFPLLPPVAIALAIVGDVLLRTTPWGLNAALWIAALVLSLFLLFRASSIVPTPSSRLFMMLALLLGITFSWRDAPILNLLSASLLLFALVLAAGFQHRLRLLAADIGAYAVVTADSLLSWAVLPGSSLVLAIREAREKTPRPSGATLAAIRGILLSLPLVFVFGALFHSADAIFKRLVLDLTDFNYEELSAHLFTFLACLWFAFGTIGVFLTGPKSILKQVPFSSRLQFTTIELNTALFVLNALFASFVIVQIPYFFGGHERILSEEGLTYADYARSGFFELVTVALLVLPLLLLFDWLLRGASTTGRITGRAAAVLLILLLGVIIASAFHRMALYQSAYGLTVLRLYVTAFLVWLSVVFVWLSLTVLLGRRNRFAAGAILTAYAAVFVLHAINPDALVARANLARAAEGKPFDAEYAATLSADAIPTLLASLNALPEPARSLVIEDLRDRAATFSEIDLRSWSLSRHKAQTALDGSF